MGGASPDTARSYWVALAVPGVVVTYALLGTLWHPLLLGAGGWDSFDCPTDPQFFVVLGSWFVGAVLVLASVVLAIMRRLRTAAWTAVVGVLTVAAGALVFAAAAVHNYHLCSS